MTKIALISDTHFGVRNDNQHMYEYTNAFFRDIFFPRLRLENIKHVIHLGDVVDRRKYVNFLTAHKLNEILMLPLMSGGYDTHIILGNHDCFHKSSNDINALTELYGSSKYENLHIYTGPETITIEGTKIAMIPWINPTNINDAFREVENTDAQILMGHLELNGFEMDRGHIQEHGMAKDIFDKFDVVCSGHYHHKSTIGNIHYLGAQLQFTWADYDDDKGFHILDTDTRTLEFVKNPYEIFKKFVYDDQGKTHDEVLNFNEKQFAKTYVKVIVKNKTDPYLYDRVIQKIESAGVANLQSVEDHLNLDMLDDEDLIDEAQDTLTLLKKFIVGLDSGVDKKKVEKFIIDLYEEALTIE